MREPRDDLQDAAVPLSLAFSGQQCRTRGVLEDLADALVGLS